MTFTAFESVSFALKRQLQDASGNLLLNKGLWDLIFGRQGTGGPNTLYLLARVNDEKGGLLGAISVAQAAPAAGDFAVATSALTMSVAAG